MMLLGWICLLAIVANANTFEWKGVPSRDMKYVDFGEVDVLPGKEVGEYRTDIEEYKDTIEWLPEEKYISYNVVTNKKISDNVIPDFKKPALKLQPQSGYVISDSMCVFFEDGVVLYIQNGDTLLVKTGIDPKSNIMKSTVYASVTCSVFLATSDNKKPIVHKKQVPDNFHKSTVTIPEKFDIKLFYELYISSTFYFSASNELIFEFNESNTLYIGTLKANTKKPKKQVDDVPSGNINYPYVLCLVNIIRKYYGVPKIQGDSYYDDIAKRRSQMQNSCGVMDHIDCKNKNQGWPKLAVSMGMPNNAAISENVAVASIGSGRANSNGEVCDILEDIKFDTVKDDMSASIKFVFQWCTSPLHLNNIKNEDYKYMGIGVQNGNWKGYNSWYGTQLFSSKPGSEKIYDEQC